MSAKSYKMLADGLASIHFIWTLFLICGWVAMIFYPSYALIQIYAMSFTLLLAIPFHNHCPLTLLEEKWRRKSNPSYRNNGSFVGTYFNKIFSTHFPIRQINKTIGWLYFLGYCIATFSLIR